ncbi:uncharacterized protein L3040_007256 [Drepanopeziza brunnea f. sp. 'multigermtubi']|uniref:uncharacterized protein n=1 Tax=Drepanopeziza brunnea f. sp. 'multigermtubi' TaxID=698441 RepID=UPI00238B68A3|nr:hypothetical protein L3040_007256 [Drepanopeziza brunnea f. sp. 'multigermtubi']
MVDADSTTNTWVAQQQAAPSGHQPGEERRHSLTESVPAAARPFIRPIRGFKLSSQRKSIEMASRRTSYSDTSNTLRALEGGHDTPYYHAPRHPEQQDEFNSDESDLFLRAAREEELHAGESMNNNDAPGRAASFRARVLSGSSTLCLQYPESRPSQRASLPSITSTSTPLHPSTSRRRGSDQDSTVTGKRIMSERESIAHTSAYRPVGKDRLAALEDPNSSSHNVVPRSTPRGSGAREISPEQTPYSNDRRSIPDATQLSRPSYRQANMSFAIPRIYNSSPLVSRTTDMHGGSETPRAAEGTESTISTTAPSTVWDELEDLKSRIHRLELTGKLPSTSGAAMSRASHDRPPTATTVTTMSSSPKQRGRGNSISPVEPAAQPSPPEIHPLLHAALAKSKHLLSSEVYKALEAAATDALAISSMMGVSGQPGPISTSQSTTGGTSSVSDRQVRRKADSMCRSLTELCLALSEGQGQGETTTPVINHPVVRPAGSATHKNELRASIESDNTQRQLVTTDLSRASSTPRALSRLEARRSSLLATTALPSPRFNSSEAGTPTPTSLAGRRTSLFFRPRRAATEEPEESEEARFRAPSRATTELGRVRQSPNSQAEQSSLPVRRQYQTTSQTNNIPPPKPPVSMLGGRRFLGLSTPDRDTTSVVGRLAEDRGQQRHTSMGHGNFQLGRSGSLSRRARTPNSADLSAARLGNYE